MIAGTCSFIVFSQILYGHVLTVRAGIGLGYEAGQGVIRYLVKMELTESGAHKRVLRKASRDVAGTRCTWARTHLKTNALSDVYGCGGAQKQPGYLGTAPFAKSRRQRAFARYQKTSAVDVAYACIVYHHADYPGKGTKQTIHCKPISKYCARRMQTMFQQKVAGHTLTIDDPRSQ
jgi:hypothetical protein